MKRSTDKILRKLIVLYAIIAGIVNWIGIFMIFIIMAPDLLNRLEYRLGLSCTILGRCLRSVIAVPLMIILLPLLLIVPVSVGYYLLHEYREWKQRKKPLGPVAKE